MSKKDLYIFIGNKLISTDTVLPLAFELKEREIIKKVYFITIDLLTYKGIEKNYVLFNALNKVGKLVFIGNKCKIYRDEIPTTYKKIKSFTFRQVAKVNLVPFLIILFLKSKLNKAVLFHFGLLNIYPWKIINRYAKSSTFILDRTWESDLIHRVTYIKTNVVKRGQRKIEREPTSNGKIIYFHKESQLLKDKRNIKKDKFYLPPTSNYKQWVSFLKENYKHYINSELKKNHLNINQSIISIMLGTFSPTPYLKSKKSKEILFTEILEVLTDLKINLPIFIKPHVISDKNVYLKILQKFSQKNIVITQLHPGILAMVSKVFISNYYSTTLSTASLLSVPTIEYTDYHNKTLKLTNQISMMPEYVDFFINRNKAKFKKVLLECLKQDRKNVVPFSPKKKSLKFIINS